MGSFTENALRAALNRASPGPDGMVHDSPLMALHHSGGLMTTKTITIAGTGAEVVTNLFEVTDNCELIAIYGEFQDVTNVVTASGCYIDLWDGANSKPITADGVDCSGVALKSLIAKIADDAQAAALADVSQCRYTEDANFREAFFSGIVSQMNGAPTYIRFRMDTDGNTDCEIEFTIIWAHHGDAGLIEAV